MLLVLLLSLAAAEPRFEDYPAEVTPFTGAPASPILLPGDPWYFRGQIRNGVAAAAKAKRGPDFAGQYWALLWGCGSQCVMMAIVDPRTGRVYPPPLAQPGSLAVQLDILSPMKVEHRPDSRLMILRNGCRNFGDRRTCHVYYFEWTGGGFRQLSRVDP